MAEESKKIQAHVFIHGKVHGVSFRTNTVDEALRTGVVGWIRHHGKGLEAIFEGDEEKVRQMVNWCKTGEPPAKVDHIDVTFGGYSRKFDHFGIEDDV